MITANFKAYGIGIIYYSTLLPQLLYILLYIAMKNGVFFSPLFCQPLTCLKNI